MNYKLQSQYFLLRFGSLIGLSVFLLLPMIALGYYTDENNTAEKGSFELGAVDATVSTDQSVQNLNEDSVATFIMTTNDTSTLSTQSRLSFAPQSCQTEFYNNLLLEVTTASGTAVGSFASSTITESEVPTTYTLDVAAAAGLVATADENCTILATLETWQAMFNEPDVGFSSVSQVSITITASEAIGPQETTSVVLNELYPAVLSTTTQPLEREWVELYNGTDAVIDVAQWRIAEFVGGDINASSRPHTIVSSCAGVTASDHMQPFNTNDTVIPAGGFLVVEFCGSASYLSDAGDTVQLYNPLGLQLDAHTYPATANGKSHARIPDGAAWVDPIPTPGNKNSATRADLEAEGWKTDRIDETLAALTDSVDSVPENNISHVSAVQTIPATSTAVELLAASVTVGTSTNSTSTHKLISVATSTDQSSVTATTSLDQPFASTTVADNQSTSTSLASTTSTVNTQQDPIDSQTDPTNMPPATTTKPAVVLIDDADTGSAHASDPPQNVHTTPLVALDNVAPQAATAAPLLQPQPVNESLDATNITSHPPADDQVANNTST